MNDFADNLIPAPGEPSNDVPDVARPPARREEETIARQKAAFVFDAWRLAKSEKLPIKDAVHITAVNDDAYPTLRTGGKNGASLLQGSRAWSNYRSWSNKLGKTEDAKQPDAKNWRALLPKYKGSRAYQRPGDERFWVILANLYEHENQLSLKYAYKLASMACARETSQEQIPSLGAARYYYEHHADQKAVYIARHGEEAYRNNIAGYITREAPEVEEAWSGDHHIFDAAVKVWDDDRERWKPVRPWLTAWVDWGALYMQGFVIRTCDPNRDAIERALRSGIEKNGYHPPVRLYVDNGKDYKARGFSRPILTEADEQRVSYVCEALGCTVHFAIPYNARAKIAERVFRVVCEQFSKLMPSYRGSNPQKRPPQADYLWKHPEQLPTIEEFTTAFQLWLAKIYHEEPSEGRALQGKCPREAKAVAAHKRPALMAADFAKAFLRDLGGRKIHRGGVVKALGREYRSDALWNLLGQEDAVRVKIDTDDISKAWIYTLDGREVGMAAAKPILPAFADDDPQSIEQLREEQKRHNRQISEAKKASAANRDMSRWLKNSPSPADVSGILPAPRKHIAPRNVGRTVSVSREPEPLHIDAGDIDELDQVLRDQSTERLAAQKDYDFDDVDAALLEEIERDQVAHIHDTPATGAPAFVTGMDKIISYDDLNSEQE